jgi:precorrin-6Y C5,15-methyltransferase (decarboxylating)
MTRGAPPPVSCGSPPEPDEAPLNGGRIVVVGMGADGWMGLTDAARRSLLEADEIIGSHRQLALLPDTPAGPILPPTRTWPVPLGSLVDELVHSSAGTTAVLASGDPMLHGIGATLARRIGPERLDVVTHPSAFALACARLRWPESEVTLISAVNRPADDLAAWLQPGRRLIIYATGNQGAAGVAAVLRDRGWGPSDITVLERLGGPEEQMRRDSADGWGDGLTDSLHLVAVECRAASGTAVHARTPGLTDETYEHDGQLTKRPIRALTVTALAPCDRELLWDVGGGSGSIAIEWLRAEGTAQAVSIERDPVRAERIAANAKRLGAGRLRVISGAAPEALVGLDRPDAVFIGGGLCPRTLADCWEALRPGGRIVVNAVTLESERLLHDAQATYGGELTRYEVAHAAPVGSHTAWRAQLPIVQWYATTPSP